MALREDAGNVEQAGLEERLRRRAERVLQERGFDKERHQLREDLTPFREEGAFQFEEDEPSPVIPEGRTRPGPLEQQEGPDVPEWWEIRKQTQNREVLAHGMSPFGPYESEEQYRQAAQIRQNADPFTVQVPDRPQYGPKYQNYEQAILGKKDPQTVDLTDITPPEGLEFGERVARRNEIKRRTRSVRPDTFSEHMMERATNIGEALERAREADTTLGKLGSYAHATQQSLGAVPQFLAQPLSRATRTLVGDETSDSLLSNITEFGATVGGQALAALDWVDNKVEGQFGRLMWDLAVGQRRLFRLQGVDYTTKQLGETGTVPDPNYRPEGFEPSIRQPLAVEVARRYGDDPERMAEIEQTISGDLRSVSYSWGKRLDEGSFFPLVEAYADAETEEEREAILASIEDPFNTMVGTIVFDPLNFVGPGGIINFGVEGIQSQRLRRLNKLWTESIGSFDELSDIVPRIERPLRAVRPVSDWGDAARYITGDFRLPNSRVKKIADLASDGAQAVMNNVARKVNDVDEFVDVIRRWDPDEIVFADTFGGRIIGGVVEDFEKYADKSWDDLAVEARQVARKGAAEAAGEGLQTTERAKRAFGDAQLHIATELRKVAIKKSADEFGDPQWIRTLRRWELANKSAFSWAFLTFSPRYYAANMINNAQMALWTEGTSTAVKTMYEQFENLVSATRASDRHAKFWLDDVGFIPERAMAGFGAEEFGSVAGEAIQKEVRGRLGVESLDESNVSVIKEFTGNVLDSIRRVPTIEPSAYPRKIWEAGSGAKDAITSRARSVESGAAGRITMDAFRTTHQSMKKIGRGIRDMPDALRGRVMAHDAKLYDDIEGLVNGIWYKPEALMDELQAYRVRRLRAAEDGRGLAKPLESYLEDIWSDDTIKHIQQNEELWGKLKELEEAESLGEIREISGEARQIADDFAREAILAEDAEDAKLVGWAVYDVDFWKRLVGNPHDPLDGAPRTSAVMRSKQSTPADVIFSLADETGRDLEDIVKPLTDEELEFLLREEAGDAEELAEIYRQVIDEEFGEGTWAKFDDPIWRRHPKRLTRDEMAQRALDRGIDPSGMSNSELKDVLGLTHTIEQFPPEKVHQLVEDSMKVIGRASDPKDSVTRFWALYNEIRPGRVAQSAKQELDTVRSVLPGVAGNFNNKQEIFEEAFQELSDWVVRNSEAGRNVLIDPENRKIADAVRQKRAQLAYYRKDPDLIRQSVEGTLREGDALARPPRNYFNITDIRQWARNTVYTGVDQLEGRILRDINTPTEAIPPELWDDIVEWADTEVRKDHGGVLMASMQEALARRDFGILDYSDRNYFDLAIGTVAPWAYWGTHNMYNTAIRMIDNPHIFSKYYRYEKAMDKMRENPDLPEHIKKLYAEKGLKESWYGPNTPSKLAGYTPFYGLQNFLSAVQGSPFMDFRSLVYPLEEMPIFRGAYMMADYDDPRFTRGRTYMTVKGVIGAPPILDRAIPILNQNIIPALRDQNSPWYNPGLANTLEDQIPTNEMVQQDTFLPLTGQIKGAAIVASPVIERITGGRVDGVEALERMPKVPGLGLHVKTTQEEYWTDQWLAQLVAEGRITPDEAWEALDTRDGPAYDAARRQALHQIGPSKFVSTLTGGTVKYQVLPDAEMVLRAEGEYYREAKRRYELWKENPENSDADPMALIKFYQAFPEYRHRQAAFSSYERMAGLITDEEIERKRYLSRRHGEFVKKQNQIFDAEDDLDDIYTPGTQKWVRAKNFLKEQKDELRKEYGDDVEAFGEMLEQSRRRNTAAANLSKYDAMRNWLDMWFSTEDPEEKQAMLEALPASMAEASRLASNESPSFSQLDIQRELAKYYDPLDQVHAYWLDKGYDQLDFFYDEVNDFSVANPEWSDQYEEYISRDWPEDQDYLEDNPQFARILESWEAEKSAFWDQELTFEDSDIEQMLDLHPQWEGKEEAEELRSEVGNFPVQTMSDFVARTASNREAAVTQIWRYWTSLNRLSKREFKKTLSKAGQKQIFTQEFLSKNYNNLPDESLGAILSLIPSFDSRDNLGDRELSARDEFDWMGPPIGTGDRIPDDEVPAGIRAKGSQAIEAYKDSIAFGDEPDEKYQFSPAERIATTPGEEVKLYTDESVIETAKRHAEFQLSLDENPERFTEPMQDWEDVFRLDRGPEGAQEYVRRETNTHLSLRKAIRENPHNWTRFITGINNMSDEEREDFFFDFPDARAIWDVVEGTEGPSIKLYRQLVDGEDVDVFEEPSPQEAREYEEAYTLFQRQIKGANLSPDEQEQVDKWFPPDSAKSKFWDLYFKVPKELRSRAIRRNELIQTVVTKSVRRFLDEQTWGVAYTEFLRELGGQPTAGREGEEFTESEGEPRYRDSFFAGRGSGGGGRSYIGGGNYSKTRIGSTRMWRDFQTAAGPLLMGEVVRVFRGGQSFSPQAVKALEQLKASFSPDMSMQEFIQVLRQMYIRFGVSSGRRVRPTKPTGLDSSRSRRLSRGGRFFVRRG